MGKVVAAVKLISVLIGSIKVSASFKLLATAALVGYSLLNRPDVRRRDAQAATLQTGEVPRQAIFGRAAEAGSLVDAFNYGGQYGTDWEVLVIALADHRCDALEGFFVIDQYVAFGGDGPVPGYNGQLEVYFRDGRWDQEVPSILTSHGPGWTANDRGRGVCHVVVAYKADDEKGNNPVWEGRRPSFRWVLRGLRCYQARKDSTVGGSGAHRRNNPATWEWTENPIDIRYNWVRGIYAGDLVDQPAMLLVGRGLSAIEAPPQNVFARANLCDEVVGGEPRYRIGGVVSANEPFIEVESDIAAACGGIIVQPEGAVEINPGEARAPVAHFTDDDLIVGSKVSWSEFLGIADNGWINTVVARFVDPAQRWSMRGAPVRREVADIIADGAPREQTLTLSLVTNVRQAERIAEIARRFGRLWGRATVTLPPRFAGVEEGDWVTWQSNRYFGGATRTFQVDAWGSDQGWRHQLTLRQISASVFSDTAPLDDGVIAAQQPPPPQLQPPLVGAWALSATQIAAGSVQVPALQIIGQTDDPSAQFVVFEFVQQDSPPNQATVWIWAGAARPDVTRLSIPVPSGGTHYMAVSYVIDGITGPRRVLGPVTLGQFAYPDGVAFTDLRPAEFGSTRNEDGQNLLKNPISLSGATYVNGAAPTTVNGLPAAQLVGGTFAAVVFEDYVPVRGGESLYFSYIGWSDVANPDSIRAGYNWVDAAGNVTANDLPESFLLGNEAVGIGNSQIRGQFGAVPVEAVAVQMFVVRPTWGGVGTFFVRHPLVSREEPGATVGAPAGTSVGGTEASALAAQAIGAYRPRHNLLFNGRFALGLNGWDNVAGDWRFVRDNRGQFVEQPLNTGGTFVLRSNRPIFAGPGGQMVISLQAFADLAGPNQGIFADIEWRNGGNDTVLGFSSGLDGNDAGLFENRTPAAPSYRSQPVTAPSPTDGSGFVRGFVRIVSVGTVAYSSGGHAALGVKVEAGTTPSAISDEATDGAVLDNTFGRIRDPEAYNTQAILGPRNVTNLVPSYTVGGSNVTVNLPAHTRTIATRTGPRTLSYGAASGVVAFNTFWAAYVDDPELTGFASPAVTFTTNPNDLLFAGRYQISSGITPNSGGTGGTSGGGGGAPPPNLPPNTHVP